MKLPRKSATNLVVLLVLIGTAGWVGCWLYVRHANAFCVRLTVEGNRQTDVLVPFIQKNRLAQFPPSEALRTDFRSYLDSQVAAKRLEKPAVEKLLMELQKNEQALPVYTERGWVMPLIAKETRP